MTTTTNHSNSSAKRVKALAARPEKKPRLKGLLLDTNFNRKGLVRMIRAHFGADAVLFVQDVLFHLAEEPFARSSLASLVQIGLQNFVTAEHSEQILELLINNSSPWLFTDSDGYVYSDRIRAEQNRYIRRCEVNKRNASESHSDSIDLDLDLDLVSISRSSKKVELQLLWPASLDDPRSRAAWAEWLAYKRERRENYKSVRSQNTKLAQWAGRSPAEFEAAIREAIGNNWAGFFLPKNTSPPSTQKPTVQERNVSAVDNFLARNSA